MLTLSEKSAGCGLQLNTPLPKLDTVRLEIVDSWHKCWSTVFKAIDRSGHLDALMIDRHGWLSARQSIVVAFAGSEVVAHLCFHVAPINRDGRFVIEDGRAALEARLDALHMDPGFEHVEEQLFDLAEAHASNLRCKALRRQP